MEKIELLAPAGNMESFERAINCGANAIYLGLDSFNARGNIENFNQDNLKNVVERAHMFGVKVYITLNTLIQNSEISEVLDLVRFANSCNVDAYIVQDIGIAYLLSQKFKGIELHASTQMGLNNSEGVQALKSIGFKRVVSSRETPLEEVKRIKEECNVDIEYFIQGALCVGFSGNCYLCSLLAGASGNRGKCKQFCRLPYKLDEHKENYYLSAKDFCMLPKLKELVSAGVTSLKIEGRARRPGYVGVAVKTYRDALDNNLEYDKNSITNLKKVFNRGDYISGYLDNEKIIYPFAQNHIGIEIGKVLSFKKGKKFNEVTLSSIHHLIRGDVIKLFSCEKELATISIVDVKEVGKNKYCFTTTNSAFPDCTVRLIVDNKLEEENLKIKKKLLVDAKFKAEIGKPAELEMICEGISFKVLGNVAQQAESQPLTKEECIAQIGKCGEDFEVKNLQFNAQNVFFRKSQLNALRRDCLQGLIRKLSERYNKTIEENNFLMDFSRKNAIFDKNIVIFYKKDKLLKNKTCDDYLVYSPSIFDKNDIVDICKQMKEKIVYLDCPVMADKDEIDYLKSLLKECDNLGIYASNYYALNLCEREKTIISSELNVVNNYSLAFYNSLGFDKVVLSKENFSYDDISFNGELFIENISPRLIYFRHCPMKEHFKSDCQNCKYRENIVYSLGNHKLTLKRRKIKQCQFYLSGEVCRRMGKGLVIEE